jgi:cell division protein FtsI (penicillin-binding protein 3)
VNREPEKIQDSVRKNYITKVLGYTQDFYCLTHNNSKVYSTQEWSQAITDRQVKVSEASVNTNSLMPDVVGMGLRDALYLLENRGLRVQHVGKGKVRFQSISKGSKIYKGNIVVLELI